MVARLLVIAAVATFGSAQAAYGQASVEGYTDPGGGSQSDVPPGGNVLGEGESGSPGTVPGEGERYSCPPGTVRAKGSSGSGSRVCVEPAGDSGTPREQGSGTPQSASSGSLPFTGVDLAAIGGVGLLLAGLGFGLRRLTSAQPGS